MHIVIAPDSFKESLAADQVALHLEKGLAQSLPQATFDRIPLADGGEGLRAILTDELGLKTAYLSVQDPWGEKKDFPYAYQDDLALIEVADLVGLASIPQEKRQPLDLSTKALGQMILILAQKGFKKLYIGLGGSASHDGGIGMAEGLGYRFLNKDGEQLEGLGKNIGRIDQVLAPEERSWQDLDIEILGDVSNPLTGPQGATYIFAGQKGLDQEAFKQVDQDFEGFYRKFAEEVLTLEGAGAAGGLAAGLVAFAGAHIESGIDRVLDLLSFEERLKTADLLILGEGRFDRQSLAGKTPVGAARRCPDGLPIILVCGSLDSQLPAFPIGKIQAAFPLIQELEDKKEVFRKTPQYLENLGQKLGLLLAIKKTEEP